MQLLLRQAGTFDQLELTHLDTVHYRRRAKYVTMKAYNEMMRVLNRVGLPLWTSSLAVLARKADEDGSYSVSPDERRRRAVLAARGFHSGLTDVSERHDDYLTEIYAKTSDP